MPKKGRTISTTTTNVERDTKTRKVIKRNIHTANNTTITSELEYIEERTFERRREDVQAYIYQQIENLRSPYPKGIVNELIVEWYRSTKTFADELWYEPLLRWKQDTDPLQTSELIKSLFKHGCAQLSSFTWQEIMIADIDLTDLDLVYILMEKAVLGGETYPRVTYANMKDLQNGDRCEWITTTLDITTQTMKGYLRIIGHVEKKIWLRQLDYPLLCMLVPQQQDFFFSQANIAGQHMFDTSDIDNGFDYLLQ